MPPQLGRKAEAEASWESHKNTVQRLYIAEKRTLKIVMEIMAESYDFHASKFQYERHFEMWGLRKKLKKEDWEAVGLRVFKRKRSNKDSAVYIDNMLVTAKKVRKEIGRNCSSLVQFSQAPSPRIPDGVMVCTPTSAPSPQTLQDVLGCTPTPLLEISNLPYFQLEEFLMTYSMYKEHEWAKSNPYTARLRLKPDTGDLGPQGSFQLQSNLLEDIQLGVMEQISQASRNTASEEMRAVVSSLRCIMPDTFVESASTSSILAGKQQNNTALNLLRTVFFSLSNNFLHPDIKLARKIVAWLQSAGNMALLESLMLARGPAFESLAEKLFGIAIETENIPLLQVVLNTGLNPNEQVYRDSNGWRWSALQKASRMGNINLVRSLIEGGADVNSRPHAALDSYRTPLTIAVDCGYMELVCFLLKTGADVNCFDREKYEQDSMPALHHATTNGDTELVGILLDAGADPNSEDWHGRTPMLCLLGAYWLQNLEPDGSASDEELVMQAQSIVKRLLEAGASLDDIDMNDWEDYPQGETVMEKAALVGNVNLVQLLLDSGANISKNTAYFAAASGNTQLVRILLNVGADPNCTLSYGACPLSAAVERKNIELVTLLLEAGAEADGGNPGARSTSDDGEGTLDDVEETLGDVEETLDDGEESSFSESGDSTTSSGVPLRRYTPLQAACHHGLLDLVAILLNAGADVNAAPGRCEKDFNSLGQLVMYEATALEAAAASGRVDLVGTLLQVGAQGTDRALLRAVERQNVVLVKMLIGKGADVNFPSCVPGARTSLQEAVHLGNHAIVQCLLDAGADINARTESETFRGLPAGTSLTTAIHNRDTQLIQLLLMAGADVNIVGGLGYVSGGMWTKATPLAMAAASGDFQLFQLLLRCGANPDDPQALSAAVGSTCGLQLAQMLLEAHLRVNGNVTGMYGCEALQLAILLRNFEMIDFLVQAGVDINALTPLLFKEDVMSFNTPPTALGAATQRYLPVIRMPLMKGQDSDSVNEPFPQTALLVAIETESMAATQILMDAGVDVNARGVTGLYRTALQAAADWGNEQLIQSLLASGADVNAPATNWMQRTALQTAAEKGNLALVKILMKASADVNASPAPDGGITALQGCAIGGYIDIASLLISKGADVNAKGARSHGRTAVEGAVEHGRIDMLQMLLNAGVELEGPGKKQYDSALELASENGHNAARRLLESHHTRRAARSDPDMAIPPQIPTPMSTSWPGDCDPNGVELLTESGVGCLNLPSVGLSNMHDFGWKYFADQELLTPEGFMSGWELPWGGGGQWSLDGISDVENLRKSLEAAGILIQ